MAEADSTAPVTPDETTNRIMQLTARMTESQLARLLDCAEAIADSAGRSASIQLLQKPEEDRRIATLAEILDGLSREALFVLSHCSKDLAADFPRHQPEPTELGMESSLAASVLRTAQLLSAHGIQALLSKALDLDRQYPPAKKSGNVVRLVRGSAA